MSKVFSTEEFRDQIASWQNRITDPDAGPGTARGLGSVWVRGDGSIGPSDPIQTYFKLNADAHGWAEQNLVNLRVFNIVRDFGAVGDGVTSCNAAIQNAVNAAAAAGGGMIYIPPAVLGYAVYNTVVEGIIILSAKSNITFFGDGYNSWIKLTGDALGRIVEVFRITSSTQRVRFYNMRMNADTLTNFVDQTHWVQFSQSNPPVVNVNPTDLEIQDVIFDPIRGDSVRLLGGNGAFGAGFTVVNARMLFNTFNQGTFSRSSVSTQRDVAQIDIIDNWMNSTAAQCIDFEPHLGEGPTAFNILGNIFDLNPAFSNIAITLTGVRDGGIDKYSKRHTCSFNVFLAAGTIQGLLVSNTDIIGNVMDIQETILGEAGISLRNPQNVIADANIINAENVIGGGNERAAIWYFIDSPGSIFDIIVSNNILRGVANVNGVIILRMEDCKQLAVSGNLVFLNVNPAAVGTWQAVQARAIGVTGDDWTITGNLVIATVTRITDGINLDTENGFNVNNVTVNDNYTRNSLQGIRYTNVGAGTFAGYRACTGNNTVDATTGLVVPPTPANVGVTNNSNPAGAQMATINVVGSPESRITAPPGSLATNSQGVAGAVIWTKDSGTGNTGWAIVGPSEITFGTLASTTATAARFFAPGGGLATETTVQIEMLMPRAGTLRNMRIHATAGTGGSTNQYTLLLNGAVTQLDQAMGNTATSAGPDTSQITVAAGDRIALRVTKTVAPTTPQTNIVVTVELVG